MGASCLPTSRLLSMGSEEARGNSRWAWAGAGAVGRSFLVYVRTTKLRLFKDRPLAPL